MRPMPDASGAVWYALAVGSFTSRRSALARLLSLVGYFRPVGGRGRSRSESRRAHLDSRSPCLTRRGHRVSRSSSTTMCSPVASPSGKSPGGSSSRAARHLSAASPSRVSYGTAEPPSRGERGAQRRERREQFRCRCPRVSSPARSTSTTSRVNRKDCFPSARNKR